MARRKYTKELYDRLVQGFREAPNNFSHASRIAGCDRRAAQRAYELGWPARSWAIPIKDYLAAEKERIRAERQKQLEAQRESESEMREKAQTDAIAAQTQEAAGSAQARANALALAGVIGRIAVACVPLSDRIAKALREDISMTPQQALKLFSSMAYVVRQGNETLKLALEIERLRVGEPTSIFRLQADEMTVDDVADSLSHLHRTLQRAVARGESMETLEQALEHIPGNDEDEDDVEDDEEEDAEELH